MRLKEIIAFFDHSRRKGIVPPNTLHNWWGAISAVSQCLQEDERTIEFLQSHPRTIRERLECGKPDIASRTIDAYLARTSTAISQFLAWKSDPEKWEKEMSLKPRSEKPVKKAPRMPSRAKPVVSPTPEVSQHRNIVRIPTDGGDTFTLDFPEHFLMSDVLRAAWVLAVNARDFDPEQVLKGFGKPPVVRDRDGKMVEKLLSLSAGSH